MVSTTKHGTRKDSSRSLDRNHDNLRLLHQADILSDLVFYLLSTTDKHRRGVFYRHSPCCGIWYTLRMTSRNPCLLSSPFPTVRHNSDGTVDAYSSVLIDFEISSGPRKGISRCWPFSSMTLELYTYIFY